jgi:hypothetical protein
MAQAERMRALAAQERFEREHFGLSAADRHAAHALSHDTVALMSTIAQSDGIEIGSPGHEIARLAGLGFIEITRANGHGSTARLSGAGWRALWLRLVKRLPGQPA